MSGDRGLDAPDSGVCVAVTVDGEALTLDAPASIAELLQRLGQVPESVAVAVNGEFVPRARRAERLLRDGDRVVCIKPIVGG